MPNLCDGCQRFRNVEERLRAEAIEAKSDIVPEVMTPEHCDHIKSDDELYRPAEKDGVADCGVVWKCGGGTRAFGPSKHLPSFDQSRNFGHEPVTAADLGMTNADCAELGF